jgi:hypothetical protein
MAPEFESRWKILTLGRLGAEIFATRPGGSVQRRLERNRFK